MKIGIIREGKVPSDNRVALTPKQCGYILANFPVKILLEPSENRCFDEKAYVTEGVELSKDLSDCDVLLGIKEVPINQLIPNKTYFIFSHTAKKQPHNRPLLQAFLEKNIELVDYELLTNEQGARLIAFGKFAGMVGAHNGVMGYGMKTKTFNIPRMNTFLHYADARNFYAEMQLPPLNIVLAGHGRVANGVMEVLTDMGVNEVENDDFLTQNAQTPVFTQLKPHAYVKRTDDGAFDKSEFYAQGSLYKSKFAPYYKKADIFINGIFYDKKAPAFFTAKEMHRADFKIQMIADISCDIVPNSSIPSTLLATTIAEPFFGYQTKSGKVVLPFDESAVTMMTIDNLPNELPRDASEFFGQQFIEQILPEILRGGQSDILARATITKNGKLTPTFDYLSDFVY